MPVSPPAQQIDWNLKGKRIAVPEMRELEIFSALLERRGAEVLRCPLVTIYDTPHSAAVLAFAVNVAEGGFDDFILTDDDLAKLVKDAVAAISHFGRKGACAESLFHVPGSSAVVCTRQ